MDSPNPPALDPQTRLLQQKTEEDRIQAIQDRISQETRSNLIRYGRARAFAGIGNLGGGIPNLGQTFGKGL